LPPKFEIKICSKQIIGERDPKQAAKDSMRSFYGQDRVDNGYFISENFSESLIERDFLFSQREYTFQEAKRVIRATSSQQAAKIGGVVISSGKELALILMSPTIV
jgi:nucleoside diphosphate kinase